VKVHIDPSVCTGHGRCYEIAPAVFREDDHGHGYVERPEPPEPQWEKVRRAAQNCPESAIRIEGDVV
jgi:ferredoxin